MKKIYTYFYLGLILFSFSSNGFAQCNEDWKLSIQPFPPLGCHTVDVEIINQSNIPIDSIKSFRWNLGDGTFINGTNINNTSYWSKAVHQYKKDGVFEVSLNVEMQNGHQDTSFSQVVIVDSIKVKPISDLSCFKKGEALFETNTTGWDISNRVLYISKPNNIYHNSTDTIKLSQLYPDLEVHYEYWSISQCPGHISNKIDID